MAFPPSEEGKEELLDLATFNFSSFRETFELEKLRELAYQINAEIPLDQAITSIDTRSRDYLIFAINSRYKHITSLKGKTLPQELTYGEPYDTAFLDYKYTAPKDESGRRVYFTDLFPSPIYICLSNPERFKYFLAFSLEIDSGSDFFNAKALRDIIREIKPNYHRVIYTSKEFLDFIDTDGLALEEMVYIGIKASKFYEHPNVRANLYHNNEAMYIFYDPYYAELPQFRSYFYPTTM